MIIIKLLTEIITILLTTSVTNVYSANNDERASGSYDYRDTMAYPKDILFAEDFYDAALKGELQTTHEPFLLSSLQLIGEKPSGIAKGGVYKDPKGNVWFVKKTQYPINEFLGAKVMDLLIGPLSPEVKIPFDAPGYTASKLLPGFLTKKEVMEDPKHKPIVGEEELLVAMNLIGLLDRHNQNLGYIDMGDRLEAARVDFDHSFIFDYIPPLSTTYKDSKALEYIYAIPDEMILYVLGIAYNNLWEAGIPMSYDEYKNLGSILIARKHEIKDDIEFLTHTNKAKNSPSLYTKEDLEYQTQFVTEHYSKPLLIWAFESDNPDLIGLFIETGADVNAKDKWNRTTLIYAAEKGDIDIVSLLLEKGADVNAKDKYDETPIMYAAEKGNIDIVSLLLEKGADVNAKDISGKTPLIYAAEKGDIDIVSLLLENSADVNAKDKSGKTPLMYVAEKGNIDSVSLLLENGADVNAKDKNDEPLLHYAIQKGDMGIVSLLLEKGADINAKNYWNQTPLHYAAEKGNIDIVSLLLEKGADVNAKDKLGKTPLHYAAEKGHMDIVSLLLKNDADVNSKDNWGKTPLYDAIQKGNLDIVSLLLENGADDNAKDQ